MTTESKAQQSIASNLSPEAMGIVRDLAETVKPLIDNVHNMQQVSKDYYAEYMGILNRATQGKPKGYIKLMAISMLYAGCNPSGINAAVKILSN